MAEPVEASCPSCGSRRFFVFRVGNGSDVINVLFTCCDCGNSVNASLPGAWQPRQQEMF